MTAPAGPSAAHGNAAGHDSLVSVVLAVKDGARFLGAALESIEAQTYEHLEILVVDGASKDRSRTIAGSFPRTRVIAQTGTGLADAWNLGVQEACGPVIAFLDSDDLWLPQKLEKQMRILHDDDAAGIVDGKVRFFLHPGESPPGNFRAELLQGEYTGYMPSTWVVRRSVFDRIGWFDCTLNIAADSDWYRRILDNGIKVAQVAECVARKRVHGDSLSLGDHSRRVYNRELARVLKRSLDRRRAGG